MSDLRIFPWQQAGRDRIIITSQETSPAAWGEDLVVRDWDAATPLTIRCTVALDWPGVLADTGLPPGSDIRIGLSWESRGSSRREPGESARADSGGGVITLSATVPAGQASQSVRTHLTLWLADRPPGRVSATAASSHGCVLWHDSREYLLEGAAARFPISVEDFAASGWRPAGAAWHLSWDPAMPRNPLMGSVRLTINSNNALMVRAVEGRSESEDPAAAAARETLRWDVGCALIRGMLGCDEFVNQDPEEPFEEGSVGAHVDSMIRRLLPSWSILQLRRMLLAEPHRLDAELQSAFGLFRRGPDR
jgi:hypothetical protein